MRDVESATAAPGAPKPSVKKMCLIFGIVIMIWFAVLVYIISGVKAPDRQSYYMDNLDFKASSIAIPSSHAHPTLIPAAVLPACSPQPIPSPSP